MLGICCLEFRNAVRLLLALRWFTTAAGMPAWHPQCRDPLFQTHWAGKNDIQTLSEYPHVKTNLKMCPSFNLKSSCCHQTFESEQQKYFTFWRRSFEEIFLRINEHRESVIASFPEKGLPTADVEQYQVVIESFKGVFNPYVQNMCFSTLLNYAAGMMCFACRPNWFHYAVIQGGNTSVEHVLRIRLARTVCLQIWADCHLFGEAAEKLTAALRDSAVARRAPRAVENLDMFLGQQQICDWMHAQVALHPFRLPTTEDGQVGLWEPQGQAETDALESGEGTPAAFASAASNAAKVGETPTRRLEEKLELDSLDDGRNSRFDTKWRVPAGLPSDLFEGAALRDALRPLLCVLSLWISLPSW